MKKSIYNITVQPVGEEEKKLEDYKGRALLIVNVASFCGFTPQYEGLEKLNRKYRDKGLSILAFPSNDFGGQEPNTMTEIQTFCTENYGISFELFDKIKIKGLDKHPLYKWLISQEKSSLLEKITGEVDASKEVQWNFEKFLVSRDGKLLKRFVSKVAPEDPQVIEAIEKALDLTKIEQ
jgi:glutathione peroxidase